MAEGMAVFVILLYDILLLLLAGYLVFCILAKRIFTPSGWTYRKHEPEQYRRKVLVLGFVTLLLVIVRFIPLPGTVSEDSEILGTILVPVSASVSLNPGDNPTRSHYEHPDH